MEKIKPIYINETGHVKVFQLNFKIRKCAVLIDTIAGRQLMKTRLKDEWLIDEDVSESIDKIAISDAFSHIERLVFPAFWIKNKSTGERKLCWSLDQIDGKWTMKIRGGDSKSVYEPEVYIRHLKSIQEK